MLENVSDQAGGTELDEAFRRAHSLKGAARAVDLDAVEGLASGLETLFSRVREGSLPLDQRAARVIHQVLDASEDCVGAFRENRIPEEPAAALRAMEDLLGIEDSRRPEARAEAPVQPPGDRIRARLPARRDGAAAGRESGSAGTFDGPDS